MRRVYLAFEHYRVTLDICRATWAATSPNPNVKIFLGVPASPKGAGSGYQTFAQLTPIIDSIKNSPAFGGVMMWDAANSDNNLVNGQTFAHAVGAYMK